MNDEEIRTACALECGWKFAKLSGFHSGCEYWLVSPERQREYVPEVYVDSKPDDRPLQVLGGEKTLPNYPEDLNACAEFEKTIKPEEEKAWIKALTAAVHGKSPRRATSNQMVRAAARQRCEAFLRLRGKWTP